MSAKLVRLAGVGAFGVSLRDGDRGLTASFAVDEAADRRERTEMIMKPMTADVMARPSDNGGRIMSGGMGLE
jgi:hypothetical protein